MRVTFKSVTLNKQIALHNMVGLPQSAEGLNRTKRPTTPSKKKFSSGWPVPLDAVCNIISSFWFWWPAFGLELEHRLSWVSRLPAQLADTHRDRLLLLVLWRTLTDTPSEDTPTLYSHCRILNTVSVQKLECPARGTAKASNFLKNYRWPLPLLEGGEILLSLFPTLKPPHPSCSGGF